MIRITTFVAALSLVAFLGCKKEDSNQAAAPKAEVAAQAQPGPTEIKTMTPAVDKATAGAASVGEVTADQLSGWIEAGSVAVFDANSDKTRQEFGKIPTATLLKSSSEYDLSVLPAEKDKKLVFYCANTQCGASHRSAEKALAGGWTDVNVLPVGVMGWKEAGKDTEKVL